MMEHYKLSRHKLYALWKCYWHWKAMSVVGHGDKLDYWEMRDKLEEDDLPIFECYCCEYAALNGEPRKGTFIDQRDCTLCPLNDIAWNGSKYRTRTNCTEDNSPFLAWDEYDQKLQPRASNRNAFAVQMVDAVEKAIRIEMGLEIENKGGR